MQDPIVFTGTYALKGCIKRVKDVTEMNNKSTSSTDKAKFVRDGIWNQYELKVRQYIISQKDLIGKRHILSTSLFWQKTPHAQRYTSGKSK